MRAAEAHHNLGVRDGQRGHAGAHEAADGRLHGLAGSIVLNLDGQSGARHRHDALNRNSLLHQPISVGIGFNGGLRPVDHGDALGCADEGLGDHVDPEADDAYDRDLGSACKGRFGIDDAQGVACDQDGIRLEPRGHGLQRVVEHADLFCRGHLVVALLGCGHGVDEHQANLSEGTAGAGTLFDPSHHREATQTRIRDEDGNGGFGFQALPKYRNVLLSAQRKKREEEPNDKPNRADVEVFPAPTGHAVTLLPTRVQSRPGMNGG